MGISSEVNRVRKWLSDKGGQVKDLGAKTYLDTRIKRYGELMDLHIDAEKKRIIVTVLPKGEITPIKTSASYKVKVGNECLKVTIDKIDTSREWMTLLAEDSSEDVRSFDVPKAWAIFL